MIRGRGLVAAGAVALAVAGVAGHPAGGEEAGLLGHAFEVAAEAFPVEPAPGSQDQPVAIRPFSSRADVTNPPAAGYARAAAADLGLAEAYLGAQGPAAEVDSSAAGGDDEVVIDDGGAHLEARFEDGPSAASSAEGALGPATGTSRSTAVAAHRDGVLVAEASAAIQGYAAGPVVIGSGRFEAHVRLDGTPGGVEAGGRVSISQATIGAVPVVIDQTGIRVDSTLVPAAGLDAATARVQQELARGGYSDVRVVQPRVTVGDDGRSAEVAGGGVRFYGTNNNPSNRYFLQLTVLGGRAAASLGAAIGDVERTTASAPPPSRPSDGARPSLPIGAFPARPAGTTGPVAGNRVPPGATAGATPIVLAFAGGESAVTLPRMWRGWPWVIGGAAAVLALTALALRQPALQRRAQRLLDEYARG